MVVGVTLFGGAQGVYEGWAAASRLSELWYASFGPGYPKATAAAA